MHAPVFPASAGVFPALPSANTVRWSLPRLGGGVSYVVAIEPGDAGLPRLGGGVSGGRRRLRGAPGLPRLGGGVSCAD